jgi:23S rRNA (pseudouridine1915-N3)-methyltransferase
LKGGKVLNINIIAVGRLKEKYWTEAVNEYSKRLSRYIKLNIAELADEKAPENLSVAQKEQVMKKEGDRILKNIDENDYVVCLEINGKQLSSEDFSLFFETHMLNGISTISFVIGGSLGLHNDVIKRADYHLSFSKMTFPHQLMRIVLLEQIYRAIKISKNEPYHK